MPQRPRSFAPPELPPPGGVITKLTRSVAVPGVVLLKVGRKTVGRVDERDLGKLGIGEGVAWTSDLRDVVTRAMTFAAARSYALSACSRRSMSRQMLATKLRQRGLDQPAAVAIANDLAAKGLIDESKLAEHLVETEIARKPAGSRLLMAKLRQRGIDARTAKTAVDTATSSEDYNALEQALTLGRKKLRVMPQRLDTAARKRRLYAQLARRGFDADVCAKAVSKLISASDDTDET